MNKQTKQYKNTEVQRTLITKSNPKPREHSGGTAIYDLKLYCRAIATKTAWYWYKTDPEQWNRT